MTRTHTIRRLSGICVVAALVAGCATGPQRAPLYDWGPMAMLVYEDLSNEKSPGEQIAQLEQHVAKLEATRAPLPPGMAMHLGWLYQRNGNLEKAKFYYDKEIAAYPAHRTIIAQISAQQQEDKR